MDFEIGNILYILITLVAVIIGILGKKKKPAGQGTGETAKKSQPGFLENLERAFSMGQEDRLVVDLQDHEEDIPVEEDSIEPTSEPKPRALNLMEEYDQMRGKQREDMNLDMILSEAESTTDPLEIIHLDDEEGTDYFEVIKDFDAGTAVVYSAIINRIDY